MGLFDAFKKEKGSPWKEALSDSNYFMARRGIAYMFHIANQQAKAEGQQLIVKNEIAEGWDKFCTNPCYETAARLLNVSPNMLPYFDNSIQKSHYPALRTATTFSFDQYRLPDTTSTLKDLREISQQEYGFITRQFKGEIIYHVTPINFMGRKWKFMVSSVQNMIYKWAISLEVGLDENPDAVANEVMEYCIRWLGATTAEKSGYLFWDTSDGNVILQLSNMTTWFDISIFITSREIRNLQKL